MEPRGWKDGLSNPSTFSDGCRKPSRASRSNPIIPDDSITVWIRRLETGDPEAAERLWKSYFPRMVRSARWRLQGFQSRLADEEDIALSAFKSFCRASGNLQQLSDRVSLWPFLLTLVARKASRLVRHEKRSKRFGKLAAAPDGMEALMNEIPGREPPPDLVNQMRDECQSLFDRLPDESLRVVAGMKLEGYTNGEIARHLGCGHRTVERKLQVIRQLWQGDDPQAGRAGDLDGRE
jgi:DNA-directed RNA polymerase specialized sigma24 family protein